MTACSRVSERSFSLLHRRIKQVLNFQKENLINRLRNRTRPSYPVGVVSGGVVDLTRSKGELILENMLLRQQLIVAKRKEKRPTLTWRERFTIVLLAKWVGARWQEAMMIVQPETVIRWHRDAYRMVWRQKTKPKGNGGRPPLTPEKIALIRRLAIENRLWGAERIHGEMLKLGIGVAKSTIQKYIWRVRGGIPRSQGWKTFLNNHGSEIWACDFLQTYDVFFRAVFVFVIIELGSRRVVHFNVTRSPHDGWVAQQMREATPYGEGPKYLIRDNDNKYGEQFQCVTQGIDVKRTPYAALKANAHCERFIGTLRRDCLDHMVILSERHLYRIVSEYTTFYNECRPHQGIGQQIPCSPERPQTGNDSGHIVAIPVLGGLHHNYQRRVA
jgi:putative transposase